MVLSHWACVMGTGVLVVLASAALAEAAPPAPVVRAKPTTEPVRAFERLEWVVDLGRVYPNPFDPDQIAVDGLFTAPDGRVLRMPAFWSREFRRRTLPNGHEEYEPVGQGQWLLRFAAPAAGQWRLQVVARDQEGEATSTPLSFTVSEGQLPGFVRRAEGNDRYLQFDSGAPYFMVGLNMAWPYSGRLKDYETWLPKLSGAGGNFIRVWMTSPNRFMETKEAGLGRYDLAGCWYYDQVMELAQQQGVYVMLCLNNHRDLLVKDVWGDAIWPTNPYNKANGGPASRPVDFFTDPVARKMYQRRLRYVIGRYSAFTSLAFWEFWNEQEFAGAGSIAPWIREMAAYVKANDPYHHLVTTSYGGTPEPEVWRMADIDLTQRHFYGDAGSVRDAVPFILGNARQHDAYGKPHLLAELGISWRGSDLDFDKKAIGTNLHNGLWAAALAGNAGGACLWWWDSYVHPKDLWRAYTGLARFVAQVDWPRRTFRPVHVASPMFRQSGPEKYVDLMLTAGGQWARSDPAPVSIGRDGMASGPLPTFFFGPSKQDIRTKLTVKVDLPRPSKMLVRVHEVSSLSRLQVQVDGKPAGDFPFSAQPGSPGIESVKKNPDWGNYVAVINKDRQVDVPAGKHTITLDNVEGDWMTIASITFTNARSTRSTGLRTVALADRDSGEVLAWFQDPASNWYSDSQNVEPAVFKDAVLTLPVPKAGSYKLDWWDTRQGTIIRSQTVQARAGRITAPIPEFRRDIALRATVVQAEGRN